MPDKFILIVFIFFQPLIRKNCHASCKTLPSQSIPVNLDIMPQPQPPHPGFPLTTLNFTIIILFAIQINLTYIDDSHWSMQNMIQQMEFWEIMYFLYSMNSKIFDQ